MANNSIADEARKIIEKSKKVEVKKEINTLDDLFDEILKNVEFEGQPALAWLEGGLCVDDATQNMGKSALLKLLSKAVIAVTLLQRDKLKEVEEKINLKNELRVAVVFTMIKIDLAIKWQKTYQAKESAKKSHERTNIIKGKIIAKYKTEKSKYRSKDEAATAYADNFNLAFSTTRKYLINL